MKRALQAILFVLAASTVFGNIPRTDRALTDRWLATMELTPGAHRLSASALHPSGLFTTNVSMWFTNNSAREADQIYRNGAGDITRRVWTSPSGAASHTQLLTWDGKRRLCQVMDYDSQNNGFLWLAEYDGLDRLLCTAWYPTDSNGTLIYGVIGQTNAFVYDPQVQFLDLGVYIGPSGKDSNPGQMTWKLCGPDLNGRYGGLNGTGGLEAVATGVGYFAPMLSDARGNVLGACDPAHGTVTWNASRPTGYGAVPGYRPLPLGHGGSYAQSAAWCGKWADVTGYIWRGNRFYDPVAGMWLSPDPLWNSEDPSYWSYCGGDPINRTDANGLCASQAWDATRYYGGMALGTVAGMANDVDAMSAIGNPSHPRYGEVTLNMGLQMAMDYANGGEGWSGTRNAFNRYNPIRSPFEAVSGMSMMEGPQLGTSLTWDQSAVAWANTISLAASIGAGAPGTMNAVSSDLDTLGSMFRSAEGGALLPVKYDPVFALEQGANPASAVPDIYAVVRGGQTAMPPAGTVFSGSMGETLPDAAAGVPHGTISGTTAGGGACRRWQRCSCARGNPEWRN